MSKEPKILLEKNGKIAIVKFNRPEVLNAMDIDVWEGIPKVAAEIDKDWDIRCVVITSSIDKAFCAGLDLKSAGAVLGSSTKGTSAAKKVVLAQVELARLRKCLSAFYEIRVPVIAAVNGYCIGVGTEFILTCDIRVAGKNAIFSIEEVALGIIPDMGSTQRLGRIVGMGKAKQILLSGARINAEEAYRIGLVEELCEPAETLNKAMEIAEMICKRGPLAVQGTKRAINMSVETPLSVGLDFETMLAASNLVAEDIARGVLGRVQKKDPDFQGN